MLSTCVAQSGECRTGAVDVTGLRPPLIKDIYAMCCWLTAQMSKTYFRGY